MLGIPLFPTVEAAELGVRLKSVKDLYAVREPAKFIVTLKNLSDKTLCSVNVSAFDMNSGYSKLEANYLSYLNKAGATSRDRFLAADGLFWMCRGYPDRAFARILDALGHDWPELRRMAAGLVGFYYVDRAYPDGSEWFDKTWSDSIVASETRVEEKLRKLARDECVDVKVPAIASLARMDRLNSNDIETLCNVL